MRSSSENGTKLTTNSSVARMLRRVSFGRVGDVLLPIPRPRVAGLDPNTLKNENGATLMLPSVSWLETQAIGRGRTVASISR
jgi:hypothetical protein